MTKQEELQSRVGKVIERSFRAKIRNKEGKACGYLDVQLFGFAEDEKAQRSLEESIQNITIRLPK